MSKPATTFLWIPALLAVFLVPRDSRASKTHLPPDFSLSFLVHDAAGGGESMADRHRLHRYPVIMVADVERSRRDWLGRNPGKAPVVNPSSVYDQLLQHGFRPIELWMIDFSDSGRQMSSIEEATDDLKYFIVDVMRYTGANQVQLLTHGRGGLLARLTILKYNIAHWVASEVYLGMPLDGWPDQEPDAALRGHPNAWVAHPESDLLREIRLFGVCPQFRNPVDGTPFQIPLMRIDNSMASVLEKTMGKEERHLHFPDMDFDALRCHPQTVATYATFLRRATHPYRAGYDRDGDGFQGAAWGGPDLDDTQKSIRPGAPEIPGDGIDQDCNGCDYDPERGREGEIPVPPRQHADYVSPKPSRVATAFASATYALMAAGGIGLLRRRS